MSFDENPIFNGDAKELKRLTKLASTPDRTRTVKWKPKISFDPMTVYKFDRDEFTQAFRVIVSSVIAREDGKGMPALASACLKYFPTDTAKRDGAIFRISAIHALQVDDDFKPWMTAPDGKTFQISPVLIACCAAGLMNNKGDFRKEKLLEVLRGVK